MTHSTDHATTCPTRMLRYTRPTSHAPTAQRGPGSPTRLHPHCIASQPPSARAPPHAAHRMQRCAVANGVAAAPSEHDTSQCGCVAPASVDGGGGGAAAATVCVCARACACAGPPHPCRAYGVREGTCMPITSAASPAGTPLSAVAAITAAPWPLRLIGVPGIFTMKVILTPAQ